MKSCYVVEYLLSMGCKEIPIKKKRSKFIRFQSPSNPLMFYYVTKASGRVRCGRALACSYELSIVPSGYTGDKNE